MARKLLAQQRAKGSLPELGDHRELGSTYELAVFRLHVDTPCAYEIARQVLAR
jgi:hypothetical protein